VPLRYRAKYPKIIAASRRKPQCLLIHGDREQKKKKGSHAIAVNWI